MLPIEGRITCNHQVKACGLWSIVAYGLDFKNHVSPQKLVVSLRNAQAVAMQLIGELHWQTHHLCLEQTSCFSFKHHAPQPGLFRVSTDLKQWTGCTKQPFGLSLLLTIKCRNILLCTDSTLASPFSRLSCTASFYRITPQKNKMEQYEKAEKIAPIISIGSALRLVSVAKFKCSLHG